MKDDSGAIQSGIQGQSGGEVAGAAPDTWPCIERPAERAALLAVANESRFAAVHLVRRMAPAEGIAAMTDKPVLHGDNGSTLKATTVLAMLNWLGVKPSYSRPRVSDDNAYAESLFRTAKYRPEFPAKGFADLDAARA